MHAEHADKSELNELSGRVMGCAFTVLNALGFLEKVHENALSWEIRAAGSASACLRESPSCICSYDFVLRPRRHKSGRAN